MTVINVYGPIAICVGANNEEQDEVFCDLAKVTTAHIASDLFCNANDFNSKLGICYEQYNFIGRHSSGHRNANGSAFAYLTHARTLCV